MSQLTYYVACSLDGFIAHKNGTFDGFVWDEEVVADFFADLESFDIVLMGRKTYDVGLKEGKTSPYPSMRQIVFSRSMTSSPDPAVELVSDDVVGFVEALKRNADGSIWLCGGGVIAAELMAARLIDRMVVKKNPVVFGDGIPLFQPGAFQAQLALRDTKVYDSGVILLRYELDLESETND